MNINKAIFLDRDGTLNFDTNYVYKIEDLQILDGVKEGLKIFKNLGYKLIVITNQSGIGRGYYTMNDCKIFNEALENEIGIKFDKIYVCPHLEADNCDCRKPKIGNILEAQKKFGLNLENSYFIGDKDADIDCGKKAGCKTILIKNKQYKNTEKADYEVKNIFEFANILENNI
ncbi:MAG: HAD family hydrolase [Candidatus Gracilibacteria bacterium]|nr:HAD family hydrolase [Candidatus Gracilibacteria bacterium]